MGNLPLASDGVFPTVQGEGQLLGLATVFVRLAGCSVGCPECDTDYRVSRRLSATDIAREAAAVAGSARWVWITGGEPTDHPLGDLVKELQRGGFRVALATSGVRAEAKDGWKVREGRAWGGADFVSVSPHFSPSKLAVRGGSQINLVPGLNGLALADWEQTDLKGFGCRWVTPLAGSPESVSECVGFLHRRGDFRLGTQAHKGWRLP
jgi:hypothetical protein